MDEDDRLVFCLDPAAVDWASYVRGHPPAFGHRARPGAHVARQVDQAQPAERALKAILSPDRHLAAFDLENTLIASNVVDSYAWLASRHLPAAERAAFVADLVREAPSLLLPRPPRPGRLPAVVLPPLRGGAGRPAARRRLGALPQPVVGQVLPGRVRPGAASTERSATGRS